jgi:hypothetical protein
LAELALELLALELLQALERRAFDLSPDLPAFP